MQRSTKAVVGPILALGLCGCAETYCGVEVANSVGPSPASTDQAKALPVARSDVETVRPRGTSRLTASGTDAAEPAEAPIVVASAVPSPQQIFDFHPAGSAPGSFRQPFIIDPNEGPLTADVRRTAAELKAFNSSVKPNTSIASGKLCDEDKAAYRKRDCTKGDPKIASMVSRDLLALK